MIYFGSNRRLVKVGAPFGHLVYVLALTDKKKKGFENQLIRKKG